MAELILAGLFLLASHFGISSTPLRAALVARLGERGYLILYALIAFAALGWLIGAWARAPYVELWPPAPALAAVPLLVVPIALVLLVGGLTTPNPTAVGAPAELLAEGAPAQGVFRITRHPFMWGVGLWAFAHLLANGDLASVLLFASLGALALLGTLLIDRKYALRRGTDWQRFAAATSNLPLAAVFAGRQRLVLAEIGWWRLALALALFATLLALHPWLFGGAPLGSL
jgi:uncharacterized membrane protein